MAKRNRVIDRDRGWREFRNQMEAVKGAHVKIGVTASVGGALKEERGSEGKSKAKAPTLAQVGWWNEFGAEDKARNWFIPERSFIRSTHDENRQKIRLFKRRLAKQIAKGMEIETALKILGEWMQAKQIQKIDRLRTPPNAPSTIRRKKSSNPLVDIGQMKQNIRYQVVIPRVAKAMIA